MGIEKLHHNIQNSKFCSQQFLENNKFLEVAAVDPPNITISETFPAKFLRLLSHNIFPPYSFTPCTSPASSLKSKL